jgi:hypothetical protein
MQYQPLTYHRAKSTDRNTFNLLHIKSQKEQKLKNPAAEQRSSPQGCTVRAKAGPDRAR